MAANNGALVQALVDGGVAPAAARVIASALANASTPQFSQSADVSDQTPKTALRLVDRETRKYRFTNLDFSTEEPYERRLRGHPGQFVPHAADHPYKDAQPVLPVPPLSKAAISGGPYIDVRNSVRDGASLATVGLKVATRTGGHLRTNPATDSIDAVPLAFASPQGLVTGTVTEAGDETRVELAVRGLNPVSAVTADGTTAGLLAWSDPKAQPATVFTPWAKSNLMQKSSAAEVLTAIGAAAYSVGTWTPRLLAAGPGAVQPEVTYNAGLTVGSYVKLGVLVFVSGRLALAGLSNAGSGVIAIDGLPFLSLPNQLGYVAGSVSYSGGWNARSPQACYSEAGTGLLALSWSAQSGTVLINQSNLAATADVMFSCAYRTVQ